MRKLISCLDILNYNWGDSYLEWLDENNSICNLYSA